jgi:hypothetical protein
MLFLITDKLSDFFEILLLLFYSMQSCHFKSDVGSTQEIKHLRSRAPEKYLTRLLK